MDTRNVQYGFENKAKIMLDFEVHFPEIYCAEKNGSGNFVLLKVHLNLVQPLHLTVEETIL